MITTLADKLALNCAGIERAMKLANRNRELRPHVEFLVDTYFALIDETASELGRCRMTARANQETALSPSSL